MSNTPETDAAIIAAEGRWTFALRDFCQRLERERDNAVNDIIRVRHERDEALKDLEFRRGLFKLQEQTLEEATTSRDEWKQKYVQQNKDLGCEMMDPAGTIWDYAKKVQNKLDAVTKERDEYRDLMVVVYNDINVIHSGEGIKKLNRYLRDENYN